MQPRDDVNEKFSMGLETKRHQQRITVRDIFESPYMIHSLPLYTTIGICNHRLLFYKNGQVDAFIQ
jgi:hypothetical protein